MHYRQRPREVYNVASLFTQPSAAPSGRRFLVPTDKRPRKEPCKRVHLPLRPTQAPMRCRTMRLVAKASQRREERIMIHLRFPEWQQPYQDAILEADPEKLREKIAAAETAIIRRTEQLEGSPDSQVEREAMKNALEALYVLRARMNSISRIGAGRTNQPSMVARKSWVIEPSWSSS